MDAEKILKELLEEYKNKFRAEPAENSTQQTFREGVVVGIRLAIIRLEEVEKETKTKQEDN